MFCKSLLNLLNYPAHISRDMNTYTCTYILIVTVPLNRSEFDRSKPFQHVSHSGYHHCGSGGGGWHHIRGVSAFYPDFLNILQLLQQLYRFNKKYSILRYSLWHVERDFMYIKNIVDLHNLFCPRFLFLEFN